MSRRRERDGYRADYVILDEAWQPDAAEQQQRLSELDAAFAGEVLAPAQHFGVLHYSSDLTADLIPGQILGADRHGRPYEVLDAEVEHLTADGHFDGDGCTFPDPGHLRVRTTVHLQSATPETLRAATARMRELLAGLR